jgi:hypothetical protein
VKGKIPVVASLLFIIMIAGCSGKKEPGMTASDSLKIELQKEIDSLEKSTLFNPPVYSFYRKKRTRENLINNFGPAGYNLILALNRIDSKNLRRQDSIVVPDTIVEDSRYYSPFPFEIPEAYDVEKLLLVSQKIQAFAAYEFGNLVKWGPTSTGKKNTPTPNGLFHTNWKAKETISTINDEWLLRWNFNISNFEGVSLHEYEMPGYPASHACARLYARDAEWFYYWAQQWLLASDGTTLVAYGTPVILFGNYDYSRPKIWRRIVDSPEETIITKEEVSGLMKQYLYQVLKRQDHRKLILAQRDSIKKAKEEAAAKN